MDQLNCPIITNLTHPGEVSIVSQVFIVWIRVIAAIGCLFNAVIILSLILVNSVYKSFNFVRCRCFCSFCVCFLGIFFMDMPEMNCPSDYVKVLQFKYIYLLPFRTALFASFISDILLILNRVACLGEKTNSVFYTLSMKVNIPLDKVDLSKYKPCAFRSIKANLFICFLIPVIVNSPAYSAVEVVKLSGSSNVTRGYWTLNYFGQSSLFKVYATSSLLFEGLVPLIMITFLNKKTLTLFKEMVKAMEYENTMSSLAVRRIEAFKIRFTKMITALTFISISTRTIDVTVNITYRLILLWYPAIYVEYAPLIMFFKNANFLIMFFAHSFDGLVYYIYDGHMKMLCIDFCIGNAENSEYPF